MNMNNIFLIGGITEHSYIKDDFLSVFPQSPNVIDIDCELLFDNFFTKTVAPIFLLGLPIRLWDRFGDYFKFVLNKKQQHKIVTFAVKEILRHNHPAKKNILIAHSLGSLIALKVLSFVSYQYAQIKFSKIIFIGSPLSSKFWSVRNTANTFLNSIAFNQLFEIEYFWSKKDIVSTQPFERSIKNLNFKNREVFTSHCALEYLSASSFAKLLD